MIGDPYRCVDGSVGEWLDGEEWVQCGRNCYDCYTDSECSECVDETFVQGGDGGCDCPVEMVQIGETCENKCGIGTFYSEEKDECENCQEFCEKCPDEKTCLKCSDEVRVALNKKNECIQCLEGEYFDQEKQVCMKCQSHCVTCKDRDTCDECKGPKHKFGFNSENICLSCKENEFYNSVTKICEACSKNCAECTDADTCLKCTGENVGLTADKTCKTCDSKFFFNKTTPDRRKA